MKKTIPYAVFLIGAAWLSSTLFPHKPTTEFDVTAFGKLPVLANGRIKPMDTIARSSLLQIQGRQHVHIADDTTLTPIEWLLDVYFNSNKSNDYQNFEIVHPDVLTLFNLKPEDGGGKKRYSYNQLSGRIPELIRQYELAQPIEAQNRNPFQNAVVQLYINISRYHELQHTLVIPESEDFIGELLRFQAALPSGIAAVRAKQQGQPYSEAAFTAMIVMGQRYDRLAASSQILPIPPGNENDDPTAWSTTGHILLESFAAGHVDPTAMAYAGLARAWRDQRPDQFNSLLELYRTELGQRFTPQLKKTDAETRFNYAQPFYTSMILYVLA